MPKPETSRPAEHTENQKRQEIKKVLEKRFGQVFDLDTGQMEQRPWEHTNLHSHCGEISRITQEIVGGVRREKVAHGRDITLRYTHPNGTEEQIASGYEIAVHAYTVDDEGKVWDPTTEVWGDTTENEYLDRITSN